MANESYIERLQREKTLLVGAIVSVKEFHEARSTWDGTPYKFDAGKIVDQKRETMLAKLAQVEPLLTGGKVNG